MKEGVGGEKTKNCDPDIIAVIRGPTFRMAGLGYRKIQCWLG